MSIWTPPDPVTSGLAESDIFNTQVIENLKYLKDRLDSAALASQVSTSDVAAAVATSSSSFVALSGGPSVTVTTGTSAMVFIGCEVGIGGAVGVAVSGATTVAASDGKALIASGAQIAASRMIRFTTLTPGVNTFTLQYESFGGSVTFANRQLTVITFA